MAQHRVATAGQTAIPSIKVSLASCVWWHRELQERLRSLVGGAITRMTRESACKDHIADLEHQLQLCKVFLQLYLGVQRNCMSVTMTIVGFCQC